MVMAVAMIHRHRHRLFVYGKVFGWFWWMVHRPISDLPAFHAFGGKIQELAGSTKIRGGKTRSQVQQHLVLQRNKYGTHEVHV